MRRSSPLPAVLVAAVLGSVLAASDARAAVFVPTKTADTADGACTATDCSLREAILAANAAAGSDVILLGAGIYSRSLAGADNSGAAGDLDVTDDLVIVGDGAAATVVDAAQLDRVLHVADGTDLEVRDVTLRRGSSLGGGGGALLVEGTATLTRTVVTLNHAASGSGGAAIVLGGASLTIVDSTLASNSAVEDGGALLVEGNLELRNSTLHANQALELGGGIYVMAQADVLINNATIAGNAAATGGGLFAESSAFVGFAPEVTNSILAGNQAPNHPDCSGPINSEYLLIGIATGCVGPSAANHDLVGTAASPIDPLLDSYGEAGGPTPTRPPAAGSPAVDAGNPAAPGSGGGACEATDQRGAARPGGVRCDLGAVELTDACVAGGGVLCLQDGRFRVTARFATTATGALTAAHGEAFTPDAGYFWFFDPANVEVTVKVVDGCTFNGRYWLFAAGMTNVRVQLTVVDTQTGATKVYENPQDRRYRTILDTNAFATCP